MANYRTVNIRLNDNRDFDYIQLEYNHYLLLLAFAYQLNKTNAELFYQALCSEYSYKRDHDLPIGSLTYKDKWVYLSLSNLQQVVDFITNEILPDLQIKINTNPDKFLVKDWLGADNLETFFEKLGGFFDFFTPDEPEFLNFVPIDFFNLFEHFNNFFKKAISMNLSYTIDY